MPGLLRLRWILPQAKNSPPDCFYTGARTGAALSNPPSLYIKSPHPMGVVATKTGIRLTANGILPRAKNSPPDCFYTSVRIGAALSNPPSLYIKSPHPLGVDFLWQRMRDSNPRKRSQSPVCYRYTNPLNQRSLIICNFWEKSSNF